MKDTFPKNICTSADPIASAPIDEGVAIPALSPDIDDDLAAVFPILPDAMPAGDIQDNNTVPESVTEVEIIRRLLTVDLNHDSWQAYESTHWQSYPAYYIVYKANSNINMPAINGKNGAPHPCMVDGSRWTLAWSQTNIKNDATGISERSKNSLLVCDNYHLSPPCRSPLLKSTSAQLRSKWQGVQIYLKGGVRFISPLYDPLRTVPEAISIAIRDSERQVKYIKDKPPPKPAEDADVEEGAPALSPEAPEPAHSVAHAYLKYGAIAEEDFYDKPRAAR